MAASNQSPADDLTRLRFEFAVGGLPGLRAHLADQGLAPPQIRETLAWFNAESLGGAWTPKELDALTKGWEELVRLRPEADPAFQQDVRAEYERNLVREQARAMREAERHPVPDLPEVGWTLHDDLAAERDPLSFTVEGLHVSGGNTLIVASYKAGKTTLALNLVRSLVDGAPFLGVFPTDLPQSERVAYLNYEVTEAQMVGWFEQLAPSRAKGIALLSLRGRRLPFWLPHVREALAAWLRANRVAAIVLDPVGRAWRGLVTNENDNAMVRQLTDAVDELKEAAEVQDAFLIHHTGRKEHEEGAEHGRGATTLEDWMDAGWYVTKTPDGTRFFRAEGRDVDVDATALAFDERTKELSWTGQSRAQVAGERHLLRALVALAEMEDAGVPVTERSRKAWKDAIGGKRENQDPGINAAIDGKYVKIEDGARNAKLATLTKRGRRFVEKQGGAS